GAVEQQGTLASVAGEPGRTLELPRGFAEATELGEQIAADARQKMVALERGVGNERIDELETGGWTERHAHRYGAIQFDHGRRRLLGERFVERSDAHPIRFGGGTRARMTGGNRGLQGVRPPRAPQRLRALQGREASADEKLVPARAVLIQKQDRLAGRPC